MALSGAVDRGVVLQVPDVGDVLHQPHPQAAALRGAADFTPARKESEHVALMLAQRGADGARHRLWQVARVGKVAGIEARGFILGGAIAHQLAAGFVPIRKKGKLPHETVRIAYSLEYGVDEMEIHTDAIGQEQRVLLVDDLIATGGTAVAATQLLRQMGANIVAACFIIDLPDLGGADRLRALGIEVRTLVSFEGH